MWVVQGATQRYIKNKSQGVRDKTLGLIVHVQDGNGELTGWYNNPGSEASSAWQVMKVGTIFQFGDPDVDKFWTQAAGNPDYGAAEGEGRPTEPMTDAQLDGFARIYADGHINEGWPFQLAEKPGERGLGWHGMGGKAWGNHPNCPGALRKAQRPEILRRARILVASTQEEDMPLTEDDARTVLTGSAVMKNVFAKNPDTAPRVAASYLIEQTALRVAKLSGPAPVSVDLDALAAKVADLLAKRLAS